MRICGGIARAMTPDTRDRQQLGVGQMRDFQRIVGDAKVEVGFARQQQHAGRGHYFFMQLFQNEMRGGAAFLLFLIMPISTKDFL